MKPGKSQRREKREREREGGEGRGGEGRRWEGKEGGREGGLTGQHVITGRGRRGGGEESTGKERVVMVGGGVCCCLGNLIKNDRYFYLFIVYICDSCCL